MERNSSLDMLKCISCFFIIYIHSSVGLSSIFGADFVLAFSRTAVPFFLMITGYYYTGIQSKGIEKTFLRKIVRLSLLSTLFYAFYLHNRQINAYSIYLCIVYNRPLAGFHLWYLYSLFYVLILFSIFKHFFSKNAFVISIILIIFNFLLSNFFNFIYYRNFLFTSLPYFLLGISIYNNKAKILNLCIFNRKILVLSIMTALLWVEYHTYVFFDINPFRDHYLMTYPLCYYIFCCAILYPHLGKGSKMSKIGQKDSTYIYIFHLFIMLFTNDILKKYIDGEILDSIQHSYLYPFIIFINTYIFVLLFKYCKTKIHKIITL